jgi:hypothetical protein
VDGAGGVEGSYGALRAVATFLNVIASRGFTVRLLRGLTPGTAGGVGVAVTRAGASCADEINPHLSDTRFSRYCLRRGLGAWRGACLGVDRAPMALRGLDVASIL